MKNRKNPKILYLTSKQPAYWMKAAESNFLRELRSIGYEIEILEFSIDKSNEFYISLKRLIEDYYFDVVLTELNHKVLSISTLNYLKRYTKLLLMPNDNALIPYRHKKVARYFDLVWLLDNQNISLFKKWSANYIHLPWAGSRLFALNPCPHSKQIPRVLFIGSPHGSRIKQINVLLENRIPVSIYSDSVRTNTPSIKKKIFFPLVEIFQHLSIKTGRKIVFGKILSLIYNDKLLENEYLEVFPSIEVSEMTCLYKKYRLSWSSVYARNTGYLKTPLITLNLRSFEIPISGGLQLVARNNELEKYFNDGHDIVFYDEENFIDIAKHYLFDLSEERIIQMKKNAQNNALINHTWEIRFKKIFEILGLLERGSK